MTTYRLPQNLNDEQAEELERAALVIINARREADAILARMKVEPPPDGGWFGSPCGASLPPPPQHHRCGCRNYTGPGGRCRTQYRDASGSLKTCGHLPSEHLET
jgi:hypothetical protein